eukprot:CAMPEP_0168609488 /NCGR_PEP_ID=MMETSP0449_2-20121227/1235_1 /TAXON_ID=1082188 /ORGANISM="Strombidium rassoulzadegani, Strain ras09" /LENGTH=146 /DNA_ID=CAMNT_0008649639 /DNA_START=169 /DNA_END=605 /DNA_ORIENTATION=-
MIKWAQEEFYLFDSTLRKYLPSIQTNIKQSVIRVAQKIREKEHQLGQLGKGGGYRLISDILRAKISAESPADLKAKLKVFESIPGVRVIKYKPKFFGRPQDNELRNCTINFIWSNSLFCELQIRLGPPPALEAQNHFLYEIERVET